MPSALLPLARWLDAFQPPRQLKIRRGADFEVSSELHSPFLEDETLLKVVEALAYLQDRSGVYCPMPSSLTQEEAHEIVTFAALARGESVAFTWDSFNLPLTQWDPALERLVNGGTQRFKFEHETSLKLDGIEIPIGRIRTYISSARLADPEAVQRDLASGSVPPLCLVPGDSDWGQRALIS